MGHRDLFFIFNIDLFWRGKEEPDRMAQYIKITHCLLCPAHACAACIWHRMYLTRYFYLVLSNIWIVDFVVCDVNCCSWTVFCWHLAAANMQQDFYTKGTHVNYNLICDFSVKYSVSKSVFLLLCWSSLFHPGAMAWSDATSPQWARAGAKEPICSGTPPALLSPGSSPDKPASKLLVWWGNCSCAFGHCLKWHGHPKQDWRGWSSQISGTECRLHHRNPEKPCAKKDTGFTKTKAEGFVKGLYNRKLQYICFPQNYMEKSHIFDENILASLKKSGTVGYEQGCCKFFETA